MLGGCTPSDPEYLKIYSFSVSWFKVKKKENLNFNKRAKVSIMFIVFRMQMTLISLRNVSNLSRHSNLPFNLMQYLLINADKVKENISDVLLESLLLVTCYLGFTKY